MNKELYEKYADKLLSAMKREGLMNKEVAEIFDVPASYMSNLPKHPEKLSQPFVEKIRAWSLTGSSLRDYRLPAAPDTEAAAINQQQADEAREKAEMKFRRKLAVKALAREHHAETAAAIAQSVDTESPNVSSTARQEIAAELRKEYERVHPETEMKIVAHRGGKVDVSKLDPRTGQVAAAELEFGDDGTFKLTYKFKS